MEEAFDYRKLDEIVKTTLQTIEKGKEDIFDISETARNEAKRIEEDLENLKIETGYIIGELERLESSLIKSKQRLMFVNKNYDKFKEEDLKAAYEMADNYMIQAAVMREKEKNAIQRRNDMEVRHKNSLKMAEKADKLVSQVSVAFDYLSGNLKGLGDKLEGAQYKQGLGVRVIKAQEEERKRVARDIHDGPAQLMANIVLKAEICEKLIDIDKDKTKEELNNLKKVVRDSLSDVRRIIYDLRPMSLDDLGLIPTVQRYANTFSEINEVNVEVKFSGELEVLNPIINLTSFRIIQESLNNVKKYAKANNVKIQIDNKNGTINLSISDDGVGFDLKILTQNRENNESGFGFYSMRERLELLNGDLDIKSSIGKGTTITARIPITTEEGI